MNLRKSRFRSKSKRNSLFKDINSPVKKGRKSPRSVRNTKNLSVQSLKTPAKHQKSALNGTLMINSSPKLNLITSTPISHDSRKRISRSTNDSSKRGELKSFNKISSLVTSSPIQKCSSLLKPCEIQLIPVLPRGKRYSDQTKVDQILKKKYSLRNTNVYQEKLYHKKTMKDKKKHSSNAENLMSHSASENFTPNKKVSKGNNKYNKIELSQHSESSSSLSENELEISKYFQNKLKLQTQSLSKRTSARLSSRTSLQSQETKTSKSLLKSVDNDLEQSIDILRSGKVKLSSKATVNKLYPNSSKKTLAKKSKVAKKNDRNEIPKTCKKISSSSKKQTSSKKSTENFHHDYLSVSADVVTIDDLSLAFKTPAKRKVKSDGFKIPGKNTLKRKRYAINAVVKADEDYEDDLYESRDFQKFKDILLDTSDSERSFSISTPKFPVTPMMRHKTPKFKDDIISPTEYAMKRKVAMELIHIRQKRKSKESGKTVGNTPETPVLAEKKKLEYSQIIADAQKLQKNIENLVEDESDNDSYFSFN